MTRSLEALCEAAELQKGDAPQGEEGKAQDQADANLTAADKDKEQKSYQEPKKEEPTQDQPQAQPALNDVKHEEQVTQEQEPKPSNSEPGATATETTDHVTMKEDPPAFDANSTISTTANPIATTDAILSAISPEVAIPMTSAPLTQIFDPMAPPPNPVAADAPVMAPVAAPVSAAPPANPVGAPLPNPIASPIASVMETVSQVSTSVTANPVVPSPAPATTESTPASNVPVESATTTAAAAATSMEFTMDPTTVPTLPAMDIGTTSQTTTGGVKVETLSDANERAQQEAIAAAVVAQAPPHSIPPSVPTMPTIPMPGMAVNATNAPPSISTTQPPVPQPAKTPRKRGWVKKTWEERLEELKAYKDIHGHCNVPTLCKAHPSLGECVFKFFIICISYYFLHVHSPNLTSHF